MAKFLEDGPLNPYIHTRWNPKTGKIDPIKTKNLKKKEKTIKIETNIIQDEIDDESREEKIIIDPLAFFNRKKKLGGVVDLAVQQKSNVVPTSPNSSTTNSNQVSLPQIISNNNSSNNNNSNSNNNKSRHNSGTDSPSQSSFTTKYSSNSLIDQNICNQMFAIVNEIDDISHPKPYRLNGMTREEKISFNKQTNDRKNNLLKQCEEIA